MSFIASTWNFLVGMQFWQIILDYETHVDTDTLPVSSLSCLKQSHEYTFYFQ